MIILNGCRDTEINFNYDSDGDGDVTNDTDDVYNNPNAPDDLRCHVFQAAGGDLTYTLPNDQWLDGVNTAESFYGEFLFTGSTCVENVGSDSAPLCGSTSVDHRDLVLFIPYLNQDICAALSENFGTSSASGDIPMDILEAWLPTSPEFIGVYPPGRNLQNIDGHFSGCFEGDNFPVSGTYHFFQVLIAR